MTQTTAKTVEDVLRWIESNGHHKGAWEGVNWQAKGGPDYSRAFLVLSNYHDRFRIPTALVDLSRHLWGPGDSFDTRMYRANKAGRARLRRTDRAAGAA